MYERERIRIVQRQERGRHLLLFNRNIDCRYFDTLKNWRNKYKEKYSCSQQQCPVIKERMEQHMQNRHTPAKTTKIGRGDPLPLGQRPRVVGGIIGTGLSGMNSQTPSVRIIPTAAASTHTLLAPMGTYRDNFTTHYPNTDYFSDKAVSYSGASVKILNTDLVDTIKTELTDELVNIFEDIPLNPENKKAMLTELADDVTKIIMRDDLDTDNKIKAEIDKAVDKLLRNHPASKYDKYKLVGDVRAKLFDIVKDKQQDYLDKGDRYVDNVSAYSDISNINDDRDLTDPIKELFENYPIHTGTKLSKAAKDKLLNRLIDDINKIVKNPTMADVEKKIEIKRILDDLHSKYPEPTDGQEIEKYKDEIRDKLFDLIKVKPKDLTDSIKKLFVNYPIHTGTKQSKDNLLNNLIEDINQIARNATMADEDKKAAIEKILDNFYSKYPEPTDNQEIEKYKDEMRDKLFDLIKVKPVDLTDPVKKLFKNYPIHTGTKLSKDAKDNLLNNLIDNINQIAGNKTMSDVDKKAEIDKVLDDFHTKYPEPSYGEVKQKHKNEIRDKLFDLINAKPKGSKKNWEVPNNNAPDFSDPSGTGGRTWARAQVPPGSNGTKGGNKNNRFETGGARSYGGGTGIRSFGGSNSKTVGVSTGSGGGMNSRMVGNKTSNRLYAGGADNNGGVSNGEARGVNSGTNRPGTIGNGIGPNDGIFGGYSGAPPNRSLTNNDRNDNPTFNNNLSQDVTQLFEDHPIFNQSPQSKGTKENIVRRLVDDINELAANNKLSDYDVASEVDKLVEKLHVKYPAHKSVQAQYKNEIRDRLYDIINNARDNNFGNRRNGLNDQNNNAGPSKRRPISPEYDFKQALNKALDDIAIYPRHKDEHRDSVINDLFDDLSWIANSVKLGNDNELNHEIERTLDRLHLWYPGAKRDQTEYRNDIRDRLFNVIKEYNKNKPIPPKHDIDESINSFSSDSDSYNSRQDTRTIKYWVNQLKHEKFMTGVDANELLKKLNNRLVPILKSNNCCGKITILKGAVLEIMSEIPATANCNNKLQRMVNDLVNNLYCRHKNDCCSSAGSRRQTLYVDTVKNYWKSNKFKKLNDFFDENNIARNRNLRNEIANLIMVVDNEVVDSSIDCDLENDINTILENKTINVSATDIINTYMNITKCPENNDYNGVYDDDDDDTSNPNYTFTKNVSIYTSDTSCCATSTPKKSANKEVQKLNDEEIKYISNLSNFIRAWMETLPVQYNSPEEKSFKEAIVTDLAGELMDAAKIAQLTSATKGELEYQQALVVIKWLKKLNIFDEYDVEPQVIDITERLKGIPVPVLTKPHQGNRQVMDNIKVSEEQGYGQHFLPKGIDVLEDEISIWVNEQPSDMFNFTRESRNNKIHNLAEIIQPKLKNKSSESEINHDIKRWLNDNIRIDKCENIDEVKKSLKDRVIKLPGDETFAAKYEEKKRRRKEEEELRENKKNDPKKDRIDEDTMDIERTMKDYIVKFIDHHYDVDDRIVIRTFNYLLKRELQKLNPPVKNEGCCWSNKEVLSPLKLYEELELVKTISDWLKNIPIAEGYHTVGNRERINLVLDLTRTIKVLEDEREEAPCAMDYDKYLATVIHSYYFQIPVIVEYYDPHNFEVLTRQMIHRVNVWRDLIAKKRIENTLDTSGINDENIGDFIEEFIRYHGTEIANDGVKMEAWSIRLLREVKLIVQNAPDPKILTKSQVYNKLVSVPIPGDDTVERFDRELVYVGEITEWMKNLPLLPIDGENEQEKEEEEENRRIMICDLAKTMAAKENFADDAEFIKYLTKWIHDLPLDRQCEINIPFLISQLVHRIERTKTDTNVEVITDDKIVVANTSSRIKKNLKCPSCKQGKNPGTMATDAIEKWSNSLPIKSDEAAKGSIERKLYQKVSEFNSDPLVFHDDLLYQTLLTVEVDEVLEKIPGEGNLQKTMEKQNKELVKSLVDARKMAKEEGAGDDYKHRLERTIDASIPSPVTPKKVFDPAFEIYKSRLADMFILENFDHSNDEVKMKYERMIKDEIDKYFNSAAKRNATRLTNHEIYNELYSALFKVPIPNEKSVKEEVEQIKTRCVVDAWFGELPLKENLTFYEQLQLEKKVEILAKRIREIEKLPNSDEKLTKKISKWLTDVPLEPGSENNIWKYTDNLQKELNSSTNQRKCFSEKNAKSKKGKCKAKIKQYKSKHNESQVPGPSTLDVTLQPSTRPQSQPQKAVDLIVDVVEQWSHTIPLSSHGNKDAETLRNDVVRKVLIKISDVNTNPDFFNTDCIYKDILNEELEKILNEIPKCCGFEPNEKAQIKSKLIEAVTALKPSIRKEKVNFNYIHDLNKTVDRILEKPNNLPCNKISEYDALKEDIVENFVQIHYDKNDDEGRQEYKAKVHDDVNRFFNNISGKKDENPQMRMNQLLCELAKVPVPNNEVLKEKVEEVRMKNEITEFLDVNNVKKPKDKSIDVIKTNLARKLASIEKGGHNRENDDKMKNEITRTLKKLNKELKPRTVEGFVNKLKADEPKRKRKVTKDDTVCEESCRMLKPKGKVDQIPCDDVCPHKPTGPIPCSDATCTDQTLKEDNTCDVTCPNNLKTQQIHGTCNKTCPHMAKKPIPCSDATCTDQTLKEDNTCDVTCPNNLKTKQIQGTCNKTCPHMAKKPIPCNDTCTNQTLKEENTCDATCPNNLKTQQIHETCNKTCPHMHEKPIPCNQTTCTNLEDIRDAATSPDNLRTQQIDRSCRHTSHIRGNRETNCPEMEDEDDLAQSPEEDEICPCQRQMREMWRHYWAATRWRCEGPDDPICTDPKPGDREMAPMVPMMAPSRRDFD